MIRIGVRCGIENFAGTPEHTLGLVYRHQLGDNFFEIRKDLYLGKSF
jgi:hypothetical protein